MTYQSMIETLLLAASSLENKDDNNFHVNYDQLTEQYFILDMSVSDYSIGDYLWLEATTEDGSVYSTPLLITGTTSPTNTFFVTTKLTATKPTESQQFQYQFLQLPAAGIYTFEVYTYEDRFKKLNRLHNGSLYCSTTETFIRYTQFGFNYELGLDSENIGTNWKYPAFFLSPTTTSIGVDSVVNYSFDIILVAQPTDSLSNRTALYSDIMTWAVAYLQQLDRAFKIDYDLTLDPFDVNYDAELVGWRLSITIETSFDCLISDGGITPPTDNPGGYIYSGSSGTSGTSGVDGEGGGATSLTGLTDITFDGLLTGDLIQFNGSSIGNGAGNLFFVSGDISQMFFCIIAFFLSK